MADADTDADGTPTGDRITIYADYVCPFCFLGTRSLAQYRERRDEPLAVDWHPFDLRHRKRNPDGTISRDVDDGKDDRYYEQAKRNVRRLQEEYGVEMSLNIATDIDSFDAQVASWYVTREYPDRWDAFDEAIYTGLWQDGRDIGDRRVVLDLAETVGLPTDEIQAAIDDDDWRAELEERFTDAHEAGVTGVPTFVSDGHVARGAVPPAQLEGLVEGVGTDDPR
ncbi:DsbA family oxidoreductase [Natrinema gelatinilyticum]|uniref:DsbA family oxidoreductase n=1 Tax=Natrinema gelatinilyticum TaxID=2961571 RepID=UPI0020C24ACA|nr:DsbA family oxidoreductase [Natrinema gelatinilyticum]